MSRSLTPVELAAALREAAKVARSDRGHDLATVLDVLAQDHRRDLRNAGLLLQLADAVVYYADPIGNGRRPVATARAWCRGHRASLADLLEAAADHVENATRALERSAA